MTYDAGSGDPVLRLNEWSTLCERLTELDSEQA